MTTATLRPVDFSVDLPFLADLYASTRTEELAPLDWTEAQKAAFLRAQFDAQHHHYQTHYPNAEFNIIEMDGVSIGRLYINHVPQKMIRIVDISLLPAYRNRGIGSYFLKLLQREANEQQVPLSIHVEVFNPALRLYTRFGFRQIGETGPYYLMEYKPDVG